MPNRYDPADVKLRARGRWADILVSVAGLAPHSLDGQHHPCPRCGGTDRFRFTNRDGDGGLICNACARRQCGDGLSSVQWALGCDFPTALTRVAEFVGAAPAANGNGKPGHGRGSSHGNAAAEAIDPSKDLAPLPWSEPVAALWSQSKPPIASAAVLAAGGRLARYHQFTVVDLPVIGDGDGAPVAGHVLYNASGRTLPKWSKGPDGKLQATQIKVKLTAGSRPGLIGTVDRLADATMVIKVEGPSDLLSLLSIQDLPPEVAVITNAMGAGERPAPWMLQRLAGKRILVIGDADKPGQAGAELWAAAAAALAGDVRNVKLPYPVTETHGKDLRDWISEGHGWADLLALADAAAPVPPSDVDPFEETAKSNEADDDPHRLARINLERYATIAKGRTLKFWRSEWYVWKENRYQKINTDELRAKISFSIKEEFDRLNIAAQEAFNRGVAAGLIEADEDQPKTRKVTPGLVSSVLDATASLVSISGQIEFGTWLPTRQVKNYLSMRNGILDIDKVLANSPPEECLIQNSPNWFSMVSIPYDFDLGAKCPNFERIMDHNLSMDPERVKVCQEWAGYVLTPDTGEQKFMILEGEGSNGKSVFNAALTAMIGEENVSTVPLEVFGERFARSDTLGKLLNAAPDCGELDKVAEGYLKPFTSGDRMFFDRKGVPGINCRPTARMMVACNQRPRFSDRSRGIWRRMLLIKFEVEITKQTRIKGMDKVEWWNKSDELPGILLWALRGLARLRAQGGFTDCQSMENELRDYQEEMNPAKAFLSECVEESGSGAIRASHLYSFYKSWISENGHHALSERSFGKEVKRKFPKIERRRSGPRSSRFWEYWGIQFSQDEILGKNTSDQTLFT